MPSGQIESKMMRLLFEILLIVGLCEAAVMFILPEIAPNVSEAVGAMLDAGLLTCLSGPLLLWRFIRLGRSRPQIPVEPQLDVQSLAWPIVALVIGIVITGLSTIWAYQKDRAELQERFEQRTDKLKIDLMARFEQPLDGINAITGLYSAGSQVNRRAFNNFWNAMDMRGVFPGVHSFGVVEAVPRSEISHFVKRIQSEDGRDFALHGKGRDQLLYVVRHSASTENTQYLLGLEVGAEPKRRKAIDTSISLGQAVLSETVDLAPSSGVSHKGVIYYRPINLTGHGITSGLVQIARPDKIAYATIRLDDLLAQVQPLAAGVMEYSLYDEAAENQSSLLFDSHSHSGAARYDSRFNSVREMQIHGHTMWLHLHSTPEFDADSDSSQPARIGTMLSLATLFATASIWLMTRRRDKALQDSQRTASENQRLATAVERTNNSVIIADENNEIIWANEAFSRISGIQLTEAIGKSPGALRNSNETDQNEWQRILAALSRGENVRSTTQNITTDGTIYWLDTDIQPILTEHGKYAGFVAVETDITAERIAAQKLRAALQESRALMATLDAHANVSQTDPQGNITHVNDTFVRISGFSREELIGNTHRIINSGFHAQEFWSELWHTISSGQPWHGQVCNRSKHGDIYWTDTMIAPFMGDDSKIEKYVAIRIDITEQKLAQEKLLTSTKLLEASQRIARVGGWELDLNTQKLFWTDETFRILETTSEVYVPAMDVLIRQLEPACAQSLSAALTQAATQGTDFDLELRARTLKNNEISLRMTCVANKWAGDKGKLTGIIQDITASKLYEKTLEEARAKAELATLAKGQFLANMSHEIRTPMNAIRGMAMLLQKTTLNAQQFDYANKIDSASLSLLGLINDILDFSKVDSGKMTLDLHPFRMDKLMRDLSVILSSSLGAKAIDVVFDVDHDLPRELSGDSMRLQQILVNLAGNAIKFTSIGQVIVSVRLKQRLANGVKVEFSVQDSGIGIDQKHLHRIFDGFAQAESSTTRKYGGTGLGLSISKGLVELMGGELQVRSVPGRGSTFSFCIELPSLDNSGQVRRVDQTDQPDIDSANSAESPERSAPVRRVLIVDDNTIVSDIMAHMIRAWNWPAEVANSGEEALNRLRTHAQASEQPFDTFYLDWQMPGGMDGWQTARGIRQWYRECGLEQPVIVMVSGNSRDILDQRTAEEQKLLNGFLVKPVTASMLLDATLAHSTSEFRLRKPSRSSERLLEGMHILVVEDNLLNQQVAEELLNSEGAKVALAANGRLGVDAVASASPQFDAVLMDIQMPVMDGFAATQEIRQRLGLHDLPIIAMTANAMPIDREECLAAGMDEHVGKPFNLAELVQTLLQHTGFSAQGRRSDSTAMEPADQARPDDAPSLSVSDPDVPGLDLQAALTRMAGLKSLYVRSAREFLRLLPGCSAEFRTHCASSVEQARMQMHSLKSTSALLGATELSKLAARIEARCKQNSQPLLEAEPDASELENIIAHTEPLLLRAIETLEPTPVTRLASVSVPSDVALPSATSSNSADSVDSVILIQPGLQESLQNLHALLQANDFQALDAFAQMRDSLQALNAQQQQIEALEEAIQNLELQEALQHCERLVQGCGMEARSGVEPD